MASWQTSYRFRNGPYALWRFLISSKARRLERNTRCTRAPLARRSRRNPQEQSKTATATWLRPPCAPQLYELCRRSLLLHAEHHHYRNTVSRSAKSDATALRPFFATSVSSFNEAPRGRFSPLSHWLTRPVVALRLRATTAWLAFSRSRISRIPLRCNLLDRSEAHLVERLHRPLGHRARLCHAERCLMHRGQHVATVWLCHRRSPRWFSRSPASC